VTDRVDKTLVVPVTAVATRYGTSRVFKIRDNELAGVEVKLGDRLGPKLELLEGVSAGDVIVTDGVDGLNDGMRVQVGGGEK
jgi:multidrug efflux pump subunit AcrA (membrane-fusion protein)